MALDAWAAMRTDCADRVHLHADKAKAGKGFSATQSLMANSAGWLWR